MSDEAPVPLRSILRELPRWKVALVLAVVVLNVGVVGYRGGWRVGYLRELSRARHVTVPIRSTPSERQHLFEEAVWADARLVPPWRWTAHEWRETVWPWE